MAGVIIGLSVKKGVKGTRDDDEWVLGRRRRKERKGMKHQMGFLDKVSTRQSTQGKGG